MDKRRTCVCVRGCSSNDRHPSVSEDCGVNALDSSDFTAVSSTAGKTHMGVAVPSTSATFVDGVLQCLT